MEKISIRNSKNAKIGLKQMIEYVKKNSDFPIEKVVEIGSYVGDSSEIFAQHFNQVICIDPFINGYDKNDAASYQYRMRIIENQFDELCSRYSNIRKLKMKSNEAVNLFEDKSIAIAYIDAIHTREGVKNDIKLWLPKIKKGGFITGHDYQGKFPGVIKAVNELLGKPDKIFPDTSWVKKVK
jgi:hypothetical protein